MKSLLKCVGSNLDSRSKEKAIEKLEICLPGIVADLFSMPVSRFTNSGSRDHAASSCGEGHSCFEGSAID